MVTCCFVDRIPGSSSGICGCEAPASHLSVETLSPKVAAIMGKPTREMPACERHATRQATFPRFSMRPIPADFS